MELIEADPSVTRYELNDIFYQAKYAYYADNAEKFVFQLEFSIGTKIVLS